MRRYVFSLVIGLPVLSINLTWAANVRVSWEAPTLNADGTALTDLAGYRLYYGTSAGTYSWTLEAGQSMAVIVSGLADGQTYYFASTAFDTSGHESVYSRPEVSYTVPPPPDDTTPPTVGSSSVVDGATNVDPNATLTVTFSEDMNASTINATTVQLRNPDGTLIAASVSYQAATKTASLDPSSALAANTTYTFTMNGLTDQAGNALAPVTISFTTKPAPAWNCPCSVWGPNDVPAQPASPDTASVELGMKFRSSVNGKITGVRYYKSAANTGPHTAKLWSRTGTLLASTAFTGSQNTGSGWKQTNFSTPISIQANVTYIVSYHANYGRYAGDNGYFVTARANGPLTALKDGTDGGNGVYRYGSSLFPTNTYQKSNYWVDVVFIPTL